MVVLKKEAKQFLLNQLFVVFLATQFHQSRNNPAKHNRIIQMIIEVFQRLVIGAFNTSYET